MAKISNTERYEFKVLPSLEDFVVGTDSEDFSRTKSYKIVDVLSLAISDFEITSDLVLNLTLADLEVLSVDMTPYLVPSIGGMFLEKYSGNKNFAAIQANDVLKGWEDFNTKVTWLEGTVLALPFTLPADLRDPAKFFITSEKVKI